MKRITVSLLAVLIFTSCQLSIKTKIPPENITLIPYIDKTDRYGYVNSETFEIVIPAQYEYTASFVNGFAVVAKKFKIYSDHNKFFIINHKNEIVIRNLDYAYIIKSEDGKTTFALTLSNSGFELNVYSVGDFIPTTVIAFEPKNTIYRLYNLNTGKLVWKGTDHYDGGHYKHREPKPKISFFDDYMTFNKDIYKIKNNGIFEKKEMEAKEFRKLIVETVKERKLENVFYRYDDFYNETLNLDLLDTFGGMNDIRIETFDFDLLIKNLPEGFRLYDWDMWEKGNDWIDYVRERYKPFNGSIVSARALNRDVFHPFLEKAWLFDFRLYPENGRRPYFVGLYNASENQWAIPPIEGDTFSDFVLTGYDDLICYAHKETYPYFYNIKTREKSRYLYEYDWFKKTIAYMGYYESKNKVIIEKF